MFNASLSRALAREFLIFLVALVLTGACFNARAQSSTDDSEMMCTATLMAGLVDSSNMAYCRGYLGRSCSGDQFASACNDGALARQRRGEKAGVPAQSEAAEMEKNRRLVEQLPRLPPESNPLLGRWRYVRAPPSANPLEGLVQSANELACTLIAGEGPSFEFRADSLVHGTRVMDSMRYYRGYEGVLFALGERYQRLLAFELDGRNRITNGPCSFERVDAVPAPKAPPSAPKPAAPQPPPARR